MEHQIQIIGNRKGGKLEGLVREALDSGLFRKAYERVMGIRKEKKREEIKSKPISKLESGLYIGGDFTEVGGLELDGRGIVKYEDGRIEKVVDGFNGRIKHFIEKDGVLYIGGGFTKVDGLKLDGRGIVKYENGRIERVVDGFDDWIRHFMEIKNKTKLE